MRWALFVFLNYKKAVILRLKRAVVAIRDED